MKVIIIILIGVTLLFAILGTFKIRENMEDAPQCYPNVLITEAEAQADAENQKSGYASYKEENNDKYILKTKIIPPKGTACPTEISGPASKYLNGINNTTSITSNSNSSSNSVSNNSTTITGSPHGPTDSPAPSPSESPSSSPAAVDHSETLNEIKGSIAQLNQQKTSNESCPPCPACERCPEPAFDCKKVPNYRSPAVNQFLPMPILNDFSKF